MMKNVCCSTAPPPPQQPQSSSAADVIFCRLNSLRERCGMILESLTGTNDRFFGLRETKSSNEACEDRTGGGSGMHASISYSLSLLEDCVERIVSEANRTKDIV